MVVKPYKLDISQFGERVRDKMKFTIVNVSESDVNLSLIAGIPDIVSIELPKSIGAGKSATGLVTINDDALTIEFEKSFTFQVDDAASTRFTIPVKRSIKKPTTVGASAESKSGGK